MKVNHLNLTVSDVRAARTFLETYFGLRYMGGNDGMAAMSDDPDSAGLVLTLMKAGQVEYPKTFHVGFFVGDRQTVDELHRRLTQDGYAVPDPAENNHAYGFYVQAPGGFTVEVGA
jgi:lactoylglutathione lyase